MGLNISKGNMYEFITHTWNTVKGECYHDCSYCYMKRWGKLNPTRFDEKELKTDLGINNFIFVGSSCDMFNKELPKEWINKTIEHCLKYDNEYLFQSKDAHYMAWMLRGNYELIKMCTTIETNRYYPKVMGNSPQPKERTSTNINLVTIEPIMDFDLKDFVKMLQFINPEQINIGADSGGNNLPEPPKEKVLELIEELQKFTIIHNKANLKRILNA